MDDNRQTYRLEPRRLVGEVAIGERLSDVSVLADSKEVVLHRAIPPVVVSESAGLRIHRARTGIVHEVEVVPPGQLIWRGIVLLGRPLLDVVSDIRATGVRITRRKDLEAESSEIGLRLWADDGIVTSATAFDPDNEMPVPTTDEILASFGLRPLDDTSAR
jgi:hypothetical protein